MATPGRRLSLILALLLGLIISTTFVLSEAKLQRFQHAAKADGSLSLLVVGDWGRRGTHNQTEVALQEKTLDFDFYQLPPTMCQQKQYIFKVYTAFHDSFTKIYTAPGLQKQWYNVLGNHDYRGDVEAQLSPVLREIDSRWLCLRSFILNTEIAEFFFVDTTPFVDKYFEKSEAEEHAYDWSGILPRKNYLLKLLKDLDLALKESSATWKIVVGHHTMKSAGHHGSTTELNSQLLPVLEENNVDLYINGHDHCLEHISSSHSGLQFLTSGGGSKAWRGDVKWWDPKEMKLYYDGQGFMSVQLAATEIDVVFYDVSGNPIHKWNRTKHPPPFTLSTPM